MELSADDGKAKALCHGRPRVPKLPSIPAQMHGWCRQTRKLCSGLWRRLSLVRLLETACRAAGRDRTPCSRDRQEPWYRWSALRGIYQVHMQREMSMLIEACPCASRAWTGPESGCKWSSQRQIWAVYAGALSIETERRVVWRRKLLVWCEMPKFAHMAEINGQCSSRLDPFHYRKAQRATISSFSQSVICDGAANQLYALRNTISSTIQHNHAMA